jgi:hypothetical protein
MKAFPVQTHLCGHAMEMLHGMAQAYNLPPALFLRVIIESVLDAASEDGDIQAQLADGARYCLKTFHVPECWLDLEGSRFEDGPDDSGEHFGNELLARALPGVFWARYDDDTADPCERSDNGVYLDAAREVWNKPTRGFSSLADVHDIRTEAA